MLIYDQFSIIKNLQISPIPKTSQDQFLGLDFSYSKTTLVSKELHISLLVNRVVFQGLFKSRNLSESQKNNVIPPKVI